MQDRRKREQVGIRQGGEGGKGVREATYAIWIPTTCLDFGLLSKVHPLP